MEFASFWQRQGALLLDVVIVVIPVVLVTSPFLMPVIYSVDILKKAQSLPSPQNLLLLYDKLVFLQLAVYAAIAVVLAAFTASKWRATPGKKILRMRVIKSDGAALRFSEAFWRYASLPLISLLIQMPERYIIYEKLAEIKIASVTDTQEFMKIISTPISSYVQTAVVVVSVYWFLHICFSRQNTAVHDILFDTRVVKV